MVLREEQLTEDGGVVKQVLREGQGETPLLGQEAEVHYVGTLQSDGSQFDSSRDRQETFKFVLGKGSVIKAWETAVITMRRGELSRVVATAPYAYGERGSPPKIPGGATLVFEIEMVDFQDKEKEYWQMNLEEKVEFANQRKEEGNSLFRAGDLEGAIRVYNKGAECLGRAMSKEDKEVVATLHKTLHLNQALMHSKLGRHAKSLASARKALDIAPTDIKTLYRVAEEHWRLAELDESEDVIRRALAIEPENRSFLSLLQQVQHSRAVNEQRSKAMLMNVFKAMAADEKQAEASSPKEMEVDTSKGL